jgi:hypothetical protein
MNDTLLVFTLLCEISFFELHILLSLLSRGPIKLNQLRLKNLDIHLIVPTSSPDEDKLTKLPLTVSPELTVIKISPLVPDHGDPIDCYVRFILFEMVAPPQQENVWNSVGCRPHLLTHTNCSAKPEQ